MIYVCEYDNSAVDQFLFDVARLFYRNENVLSIKEEDRTGIRWKKLRERILAWMLLEYALEKEGSRWIKEENTAGDVENQMKRDTAGRNVVEKLEIVRTKHGKPYSSRYPELFFNISHCDRACACVLSDCPVGIDIERKFEYKENLKSYVCCEEELCALECFDDDSIEKEQHVLEGFQDIYYRKDVQLRFLWSMKEAFVKMDGRGLGYGLKKINLAALLPVKDGVCSQHRNYESGSGISCEDRDSNRKEGRMENGSGYMRNKIGGTADHLVFRVKAAEYYTLAVCSRQKNLGEVYKVSERELMEMFIGKKKLQWT